MLIKLFLSLSHSLSIRWDIDLNSNDFLGRVETTLAEIITLGKNRQFIRQITGIENKNCGDLIIKVEELSTCKQNLIIKLRTVDLCKTHFFKPRLVELT